MIIHPKYIVVSLLSFTSIFFITCQTSKQEKIGEKTANLKRITEADSIQVLQAEGVNEGGDRKKLRKRITLSDVTPYWKNNKLQLCFVDSNAYISVLPKAIDLPTDWENFKSITMTVENQDEEKLYFCLGIKGVKNILSDTIGLKPNETVTNCTNLTELPLTNGNKALYKPNAVVFKVFAEKYPCRISIEKMALIQIVNSDKKPVMDKFGQRIYNQWNGKVSDSIQLRTHLTKEKKQLKDLYSTERDSFGGIIEKNNYKATGFFYITENNGKWWFITPNGNRFWSLGVTCLRPKYPRSAVTMVKNREFLFEALPPKSVPYSGAYDGDTTVNFYYWNVLRKYDSLPAWRNFLFRRMKAWGLNTIGNWSEKTILKQSRMPFTYSFRTTRNKKLTFKGNLSDVFNPEWEKYIDSVFSEAAEWRDNPYLLGYFVDNEAGWGNPKLLEKLPENCPTRKEWENMIKKQYKTIENLNKNWNTNFKTWEAIKNHRKNIKNEAFKKDMTAFEAHYAKQYFKLISNTLKKHDPNHLYLGCRFTKRVKPAHILKQAGKYCDVVTVNVYSLIPENERMKTWYNLTRRPILIGEHHLPKKSNRQLPPHYQTFTSNERNHYYKQYVKTWAEMPFSVGCHWYQLVDQHITGRASNGENQVIGLVDITDQPHNEMIEAIKHSSKNIYKWHE